VICTVPNCERKQYGRGMCHMHWQRWRKHGDPAVIHRTPPRYGCEVAGCEGKHVARGFCDRHYKRLMQYGDPLALRFEHHGHAGGKSTEYLAWASIKQRTANPKCNAYKNYGARGITMFIEWQKSYLAFLRHVGPRPGKGYSIDRYPDNNGNYEPGNVRWATKQEQNRNQRRTVNLTIDGVTRCVAEWSKVSGVCETTIHDRLRRDLEPRAAVFTQPRRKTNEHAPTAN
jgi:hypothetical protein